MGEYLLQTENGVKPPKYVHQDINLAIAEAKRLHELYKTPVRILEIIGVVKEVEVPVTRKIMQVIWKKEDSNDELPF